MSEPVIRVESLGKRYQLGLVHHDRLAEAIAAAVNSAARAVGRLIKRKGNVSESASGSFRAPSSSTSAQPDHIWALRDVSFEVRSGEVVGIIGKNGAGKSTLLKVLAGITEPTEGRARIDGRVGSLLEVGTGFHPELTGRENIFLNGAILGMSRVEVRSKFDEIVAFAEIEKFIDTPVKRYSSGMYVRLAFAVAAHLEPEIMLVDEVLAVGDVSFQRKCLGKMGDVAGQGRTILFVSHNMAAIANLCHRAVLLSSGAVVHDGEPAAVIDGYMNRNTDKALAWQLDRSQLSAHQRVGITDINLQYLHERQRDCLTTGGSLVLDIEYEVEPGVTIPSASFVVCFKNQTGVEIFRLSNTPISGFPIVDLMSRGRVKLVLPVVPLTGGRYFLDVGIGRKEVGFYTYCSDVVSLCIESSDVYGSGEALDQSRGVSAVVHRWVHCPEDGRSADSGWIGCELLSIPQIDLKQ